MGLSESAEKLRKIIEHAIDDHEITRAEMDEIMHIAHENHHIDPQEQALLDTLHDMINHKEVKIVP